MATNDWIEWKLYFHSWKHYSRIARIVSEVPVRKGLTGTFVVVWKKSGDVLLNSRSADVRLFEPRTEQSCGILTSLNFNNNIHLFIVESSALTFAESKGFVERLFWAIHCLSDARLDIEVFNFCGTFSAFFSYRRKVNLASGFYNKYGCHWEEIGQNKRRP